jgi:16S rRNA (guanine527-N7)-methyltransferase
MLAAAGIERGLLGPREVPRLWPRHLLNCVALIELVSRETRLVDVGTGAGLPGLVVALARPDVQVDLVESLQRRVDFLEEVVAELGIGEQVRVVRGRAEEGDVLRAVGGAPYVTARAVAPLDRLVKWCLPLLAPHGELLALKGATASDELALHETTVRRAGGVDARIEMCGSLLDEQVPVIVIAQGKGTR